MANGTGGGYPPTPTPTMWVYGAYEVTGTNPSIQLAEKLLWTDEITLSEMPADLEKSFKKLPENTTIPTDVQVTIEGTKIKIGSTKKIQWHGVTYTAVSGAEMKTKTREGDTSILPFRINLKGTIYQREIVEATKANEATKATNEPTHE